MCSRRVPLSSRRDAHEGLGQQQGAHRVRPSRQVLQLSVSCSPTFTAASRSVRIAIGFPMPSLDCVAQRLVSVIATQIQRDASSSCLMSGWGVRVARSSTYTEANFYSDATRIRRARAQGPRIQAHTLGFSTTRRTRRYACSPYTYLRVQPHPQASGTPASKVAITLLPAYTAPVAH